MSSLGPYEFSIIVTMALHELEVNGQQVGALIPHSGVSDNDTGSTSVVVHVNKGEDVFMRTNMISNNGGIHSDSNDFSSISG